MVPGREEEEEGMTMYEATKSLRLASKRWDAGLFGTDLFAPTPRYELQRIEVGIWLISEKGAGLTPA
ncbi:MAG: hypothetical protein JWM80_3332 [Cyanobacteria bacterium RYN_339]|nr:hypothetical protein [Cyanobacteria bacterium RYN_339]